MIHAAELPQQLAGRRLAIATNPNAVDPNCDISIMDEYRKCFSLMEVGNCYEARFNGCLGIAMVASK